MNPSLVIFLVKLRYKGFLYALHVQAEKHSPDTCKLENLDTLEAEEKE